MAVKRATGLAFHPVFSQCLRDARARQEINRGLPKLRRGFCRFQASDGSIHDVPDRYLDQAFTIDQWRCFRTGSPCRFTLLGNDALRRFDREILATFRWCLRAHFGRPQSNA